jgi:hypothetical protein
MKTYLIVMTFVLVAGWSAAAQVPQDDARPGVLSVRDVCPVSLATARVELRDTPTGIAVTFTAAPAEVQELRRRVELLAKKHRAAAEGEVDTDQMPAGAMKLEFVPEGARLTLTPMDSHRLAMFRSRVQMLVEKMREGDCEIMPEAR